MKLEHERYNRIASNPGEEYAVEIVKKLKNCVQLVQLEIADSILNYRSPRIAKTTAMYHRKNFDMFISGVQHRTW